MRTATCMSRPVTATNYTRTLRECVGEGKMRKWKDSVIHAARSDQGCFPGSMTIPAQRPSTRATGNPIRVAAGGP